MSRRRWLTASAGQGAALAAGAAWLAGCESGSQAPASRATPAPAKLAVFIGPTGDSQRLLGEKLLPAFTERHPSVAIEYGGPPNLEKIQVQYAGGSTPDIFLNGAAFAPIIVSGKLALPIDDRIKAWGKLSVLKAGRSQP